VASKRRLLVCTQSYSIRDGLERILEQVAKMLPARGYEVTFGLVRGIGVPPALAETLRRFAGCSLVHADAGLEWPHWSGLARAEELEEIRAFVEREERAR
jgi:hypothetical protein